MSFYGICGLFGFISFSGMFILLPDVNQLVLGMDTKNEMNGEGSAGSPTSVLEDEVCFLFPLMTFLSSYFSFCLVHVSM